MITNFLVIMHRQIILSYAIRWIARLRKAMKGVASYEIALARRMQP